MGVDEFGFRTCRRRHVRTLSDVPALCINTTCEASAANGYHEVQKDSLRVGSPRGGKFRIDSIAHLRVRRACLSESISDNRRALVCLIA